MLDLPILTLDKRVWQYDFITTVIKILSTHLLFVRPFAFYHLWIKNLIQKQGDANAFVIFHTNFCFPYLPATVVKDCR